jgi:hypothetical protein
MLDIFRNSAFTVTALTDAMREVKFVPGLITSMGLFNTSSVSTLSVAIEKDKTQNLILVPTTARGGPGTTFGKNKRNIRDLRLLHQQVDDGIMADEVQGVRAFGDEFAIEQLQAKIADRAAEASQFFALTEEFQRVKILTDGKLIDADGTTTLFDFYAEFGETKPAAVGWDLAAASPVGGILRKRCSDMIRAMSATLDGLPFSGINAICGDAFFDALIQHVEVRATYLNHAAASDLRTAAINNGSGGSFGSFAFGGITFMNYRGSYNSTAFVNTDQAHFFPSGVPNLFRTVYGPADYIETVNRPGQRLYAKQWEMPNGKGVNLEMQSNPLHYCTRPRVLMTANRTT